THGVVHHDDLLRWPFYKWTEDLDAGRVRPCALDGVVRHEDGPGIDQANGVDLLYGLRAGLNDGPYHASFAMHASDVVRRRARIRHVVIDDVEVYVPN